MASLEDFAGVLGECRTLDDVKLTFRAAIATEGFSASACGCFVPSRSGPVPRFYFQDWPAEWLALYQRENFVASDYSVAEARQRIAPFVWSEVKRERKLSPDEARVWQAALDFGWKDGFSVPVHGPGGYFGLITMAGHSSDIPQDLRRRLHVAGFAAHERCRRISGGQLVASLPDRLTVRELECLRWVAAGLSDTEIAGLLKVSATTVKFHVDAGRRKLGSKTRAHATAMLVIHGLI